MNCIKCGGNCIISKKSTYHPAGQKYPYEIRTYVCEDLTCLTAFSYRNTFMTENERVDAERFIRLYNRRKEENQNQTNLFEHENNISHSIDSDD